MRTGLEKLLGLVFIGSITTAIFSISARPYVPETTIIAALVAAISFVSAIAVINWRA